MLYTIETIREKTKDIMNKAIVDFQTYKEMDKEEKAKTLKPGENMGFPTNNGFYSAELFKQCEQKLSGYQAEVNKMLEDVRAEVKKKSAEPPTPEQANLVNVLSIGRADKTELQNALDENISNYATYSAINRIAATNGIHLDGLNPLDNLLNCQSSLARSVNNLSIRNAEKTLNPAFMEFSDIFDTMF